MPKNFFNINQSSIVKLLLVIIFVSALASCAYLLSIPADEKNILVWNYSLNRLIMAGFFIGGAALTAYLFFVFNKHQQVYLEKIISLFQQDWFKSFLLLFFVVTLLFVWMSFMAPAYILQKSRSIVERMRPLGLWLLVIMVALITLEGSIKETIRPNRIKKIRAVKIYSFAAILVFGSFLLAFYVYPAMTDDLGIGRYSVTLMITQIIFTWAIITVLTQAWIVLKPNPRSFISAHFDIIIFFGLWAVAAFLWVNQPIQFMDGKNFTAIHQHMRPLPPNFEIYPSRDSQAYYFISESIVMGKGIYRSLDKSLFLALEGFNNWISGGSYERMLNHQTIMLAVFPGIIYLIGKELHSRSAGLMSGVLAVMHELNAIKVVDELPLANMKVLLSEPFVQLFCALIVLLTIWALKSKDEGCKGHLFLISGGVLGLSAMIRLNTLVIAPFILFIIFFTYLREHRKWISYCAVFLVGMLLALSPLMVHHAVKYNNPLAFMKGKVQSLILNNRYEKIIKSSSVDLKLINTTPAAGQINYDDQVGYDTYVYPEIKAPAGQMFMAGNMVNALIDDRDYTDRSIMSLSASMKYAFRELEVNISCYSKVMNVISRHFLNNVITSFSILPTSSAPQNLYHAARGQLFWGDYDAVNFLGISPLMLVINLFVLSLGIASAVNHHRLKGLIPMVVFFGYHLSSSMAVTSGNRYTQPVSWVIFLYYVLGLMTIGCSLLRLVNGRREIISHKENKKIFRTEQKPRRMIWLTAILILVIGSAPAAADLLPTKQYPVFDKGYVINSIFNRPNCLDNHEAEILEKQINKMDEKKLKASIGRALQPVQYDQKLYKDVHGASAGTDYERFLSLLFFSPESRTPIRLIFESTGTFPKIEHGSDVMVVWRDTKKNKKALFLGIIDKDNVYPLNSDLDLSALTIECWTRVSQ